MELYHSPEASLERLRQWISVRGTTMWYYHQPMQKRGVSRIRILHIGMIGGKMVPHDISDTVAAACGVPKDRTTNTLLWAGTIHELKCRIEKCVGLEVDLLWIG